jgi:hypothetical protein
MCVVVVLQPGGHCSTAFDIAAIPRRLLTPQPPISTNRFLAQGGGSGYRLLSSAGGCKSTTLGTHISGNDLDRSGAGICSDHGAEARGTVAIGSNVTNAMASRRCRSEHRLDQPIHLVQVVRLENEQRPGS